MTVYNVSDTKAHIPYTTSDEYETLMKQWTRALTKRLTRKRKDTDATPRERNKRFFSLDLRQNRRALQKYDNYRVPLSQWKPLFGHLRPLESRGSNKLRDNPNSQKHKPQIYHQFLNRYPLYRLQIKRLQDSNNWIKTVKRQSNGEETKDENNYFNCMYLDFGGTNKIPHLKTR